MTKEDKKLLIQNFLIAGVALVFLIACFKFVFGESDTNKDICRRCYYYSQQLVKDELKSPKSAKFPVYDESFADYDESKGIVIISAYVDADNSFGANIRTKYVATITVSNGEPKSGFVVI